MKLPDIPCPYPVRRATQTSFGGLDHNEGAGDGSLWDMKNLTGDYAPLLATRDRRGLYRTIPGCGGLFAWEDLCWTEGTGFYCGGVRRGTVTAGKKTFAALGAYIVIFPDKACYNTETGEFGSLEAGWSGNSLTFTNGRLFEEEAEANTLQCDGVDWSAIFRAGDAVEISGCTRRPENNKTPVIREIDGDKLYFYENAFRLDGEKGETPYTETGSLSVRRRVPDLAFLCENENRLWGCAGNTIYASKLGDIFNWNVFEGLETDSYAVDTGSAGRFTGCVSFLGYPIFFKEDHIYKVYGSRPSNFELMGSATLGVAAGSGGSAAVAGETLFYLSRAGYVAYAGGIPQPVGAAFGREKHKNAVAGSDGLKYYVSAEIEGGGTTLCVYDTQRGLWHREDETRAAAFARWRGALYFLNDRGEIWSVRGGEGSGEAPFRWFAESGDFTEGSPDKKGVSSIRVRLELEAGASARALLQFDSGGGWLQAGEAIQAGDAKRSFILPIVPRRGDHCRLRLEGTGGCRVYSITREFYAGSALKSQRGRQ